MKKNILIIFLSIISAIQINAQADCFFKYCYIGKVSLNKKTAKSNDIFDSDNDITCIFSNYTGKLYLYVKFKALFDMR